MRTNLLEILQCPFCGSSLMLEPNAALEVRGEEVIGGVLSCQCSAYPIVDGIPVFTAGYAAETAIKQLEAGEKERALFTMLELFDAKQAEFERLVAKGDGAIYREAVEILCPDAEGTYFVYRFSDPTYLAGQAIVRAAGSDRRCFAKRAIDLCGGSGHLTRVLSELSGGAEVILADAYFWKLWLARRITAPDCVPVCCDGESPLPFKREAFSFAVCSDAFHYIWSKQLLASEMMRLIDGQGTIVLSHLHNALCENFSAGMPLAPQWYRNLFEALGARVFKEGPVLDSLLAHNTVDLSPDYADEQLQDEPALFLIATRLEGLFRRYELSDARPAARTARINPLYKVERKGEDAVLQLQFPSPDYEEEFGACKRYLPERVELKAGTLKRLAAGEIDGALRELAENYVLLDVPKGYL